MVGAVDYLLGRNPLDYSYVTGYGVHSAQYPHHRWWAVSLNDKFPKALIVGHHDLNHGKPCPVYDVVTEYWDLQPSDG